MNIRAVIPTYKRPESLERLLRSVDRQVRKPDEVIIVNGGGADFFPEHRIRDLFPSLPIQVVHTEASVCLQRNTGMRMAQGGYIFLCDDDIELPPVYLKNLEEHLDKNPLQPIATGLVMENDGSHFACEFPSASVFNLLYKHLFFHSIWEPLSSRTAGGLGKPVLKYLQSYYKKRGNTQTPSGLPLLTDFSDGIIHTRFYGLGVSLVRREWLQSHLFDEVLDPSGIGDNYGIALGLEPGETIHVLKNTPALHHKEPVNRLKIAVSYKRRLLALDYFLRESGKSNSPQRMALAWSVVGNLVPQLLHLRWPMALASLKLLATFCSGKNPYVVWKRKGKKFCQP